MWVSSCFHGVCKGKKNRNGAPVCGSLAIQREILNTVARINCYLTGSFFERNICLFDPINRKCFFASAEH